MLLISTMVVTFDVHFVVSCVNSFISRDMIFTIAKQISYLSQGTTLEAGTVILTGTPAGIGYFREPRVVLEDGGDIRIEIEHIGTLVNKVRYEEW